MELTITALVAGSAGGFFAFLGSVLRDWLIQRGETQRQSRQLAIEAAIAQYSQMISTWTMMLKDHEKVLNIPKFDVVLIQKLKLMDLLGDPKLSQDELVDRITELRDFSDTLQELAKRERNKN